MSRQEFFETLEASAPENYERFFVPAIGRPIAVELVRAASLRAGERVLDVGCGTGIVARLAASEVGPGGTVAGLDVNEGMLAVAAGSDETAPAIEWHQASMEDMPFADAAFDVVLCQMSLQFAADRQKGLREMRRVLAPGGRLALNVPGPTPAPFRILADAATRELDPRAGGFVDAVFSLHEESELEALLRDAGFRDISARASALELRLPAPREFLWQYVGSTPLAALAAAADEDARAGLEGEVVAGWSEFADGDRMRMPVRVVTATARR